MCGIDGDHIDRSEAADHAARLACIIQSRFQEAAEASGSCAPLDIAPGMQRRINLRDRLIELALEDAQSELEDDKKIYEEFCLRQ